MQPTKRFSKLQSSEAKMAFFIEKLHRQGLLEEQQMCVTVEFQDGIKSFFLPDFIHLAASSSLVFEQISTNSHIYLPVFSSDTVEKILAFLRKQTLLLDEQDAPSFINSVRYLLFDEDKIKAFLPIYACLSLEDLILHMDLFPNNQDIDAILARALYSRNIHSYYRQRLDNPAINRFESEAFGNVLKIALNRFRNEPESEVHKEFRRAFSPLVFSEILNKGALFDEIASIDPPIELDVSPQSIDLLQKEPIVNRLTHCTIVEGTKSFYLQSLEILLSKPSIAFTVQDRCFLQKVQEEYGSNEIVVKACIDKNGAALQFADQAFKANKEMVLLAVKRDGTALQFAADFLRGDREVVLEAIKQNFRAFSFAAIELQRDEKMRCIFLKIWKLASHYNYELQVFLSQRGM